MSLKTLLSFLPDALRAELSAHPVLLRAGGAAVAEVRLRCGKISSLSLFREGRLINLPLSHICSEEEMRLCFSHAAGGSVYAHEESIKEGYLRMDGGIRVGVCGKATVTSGTLRSLSTVTSLVFRLPHGVPHAADALCAFFERSEGGILVFAPPGGGKTTLLRELIRTMGKRFRIAAVDTREELDLEDGGLLFDRLAGYPKASGAEIAVRTLSPELLVLDEVGAKEAEALCSLVSFGVRTVASVHAQSAGAVRRAPALAPLLRSGLFAHLWDARESLAYPVWETDA